MKKFLSVTISLIIAVFAMPFSAFSQSINIDNTSVSYSIDAESGIMIISGEGAIPDYASTTQPWYNEASLVKTLVIKEGITAVGSNAFRQFINMTEVYFPTTLISLGDHSFFHAAKLQTITFSKNITSIGEFAFAGCENLSSLRFKDMSISLGLGIGTFVACPKLKVAEFPYKTSFSQYAVGVSDEEYGTVYSDFTLYGVENSGAMFYAENTGVNFHSGLFLDYGIQYGRNLVTYNDVDYYEFTPTISGKYHFYSTGSLDMEVSLYNSDMSVLIDSNDDISMMDYNFELTSSLIAGETYIYKVNARRVTGDYKCSLYPEIDSISASLPQGFTLYQATDSVTKTDKNGAEYSYYNMSDYYNDVKITVSYKNGYTDSFYYNTDDYNRSTFSLSDKQETSHFENGVNYINLTYGKNTYDIPFNIHVHSYTLTHTDPTCTTSGADVYTCSCGDTYTNVIEPLGHVKEYACVPATCTESGYYYEYCSRCNEMLTEKQIDYPTGHYYTVTDEKEPTLTEEGYRVFTCSNCGESYTAILLSTGKTITGRVVVMETPNGDHSSNIPLGEGSIIAGHHYASCNTDGTFSLITEKSTNVISVESPAGPTREVKTDGESNVDLGDIAVIAYDFNRDGYINVKDYYLFSNQLIGLTEGDDDFIASFDFNQNGEYDRGDLAGFKNFYSLSNIDSSIYK